MNDDIDNQPRFVYFKKVSTFFNKYLSELMLLLGIFSIISSIMWVFEIIGLFCAILVILKSDLEIETSKIAKVGRILSIIAIVSFFVQSVLIIIFKIPPLWFYFK